MKNFTKRWDCYLALLIFLTCSPVQHLFAQNRIPVIKANSKAVDVIDGEHFKKSWWAIMPERKPDFYYVSIPHKPHRVVFRTDIDSIAFDTQYGGVYDFIILFKGDSCHTRIIAKEKELLLHNSLETKKNHHSDTIPIRIGKNSKIYINGTINGSAPLNFQFDLGAGGSIIKKGSIKKVKFNFDGKTILSNSDGTEEVPTSSKNTLQLGSMKWEKNITWVVGDNMDKDEDGLLGNNLFLDKIIEINYDGMFMAIHDSLPEIPVGYNRQSFILDGVVPFVKGKLRIGKEIITDWYMFDTGYSGILRIGKDFSIRHQLEEKTEKAFNPFRTTLILPEFEIGNYRFDRLKAVTQPIGGAGILGNKLLKRYNVILDNRTGFIYLSPNRLMDTTISEDNIFAVLYPWIAGLLLLIILIIIFRKVRRKR